jgi:hypothetical protein
LKKRRSTVYVRPGKDVTLYVPAETPPEVIDYLNHLKEEGNFSQGVMEILTRFVQQQGSVHGPGEMASQVDHGLAAISDPDTSPAWLGEEMATEDDPHVALPRTEELYVDPPATTATRDPAPRKKLDLAQIFRQAQRNSGRLLESRENS